MTQLKLQLPVLTGHQRVVLEAKEPAGEPAAEPTEEPTAEPAAESAEESTAEPTAEPPEEPRVLGQPRLLGRREFVPYTGPRYAPYDPELE